MRFKQPDGVGRLHESITWIECVNAVRYVGRAER